MFLFFIRPDGCVPVVLRAALLGVLLGMTQLGTVRSAEPSPGVLELPGGGTLPGTLVPAAATDAGLRDTLLWKSPIFAEPFEFHLDAIVGARFGGPWPNVAAPFRLHFQDGDVLDGTIDAIDATHVTVRPAGPGNAAAIRVRRSVIDGIVRLGGTLTGGYVGPSGLMGWDCSPANVWRAEAGRIVASRPGSASLDIEAQGRACYDVVLSWRRKPEFRLAVVAASKPAADAFWVEFLEVQGGESVAAVIRQEANRAAVEPLALPAKEATTARIVIFVDHEKGRLAAFTVEEGKAGPVTDITLAPPADREASGRFRITLGRGDVCLESLRVGPWTTLDPAIDQRAASAVATRDGRVIEADIESFDKASGELVVTSSAGTSRIKLDEVDDISLVKPAGAAAGQAGQPGTVATVRVVRASGGTLAGRLVAVEENAVRLRVEGIDDVVDVPLEDVASITALAAAESPGKLTGRAGSLLAEGVSLRGCLVDGGPWSAGLAWQPQGSATASPLAATADLADVTIEYVPRPIRNVISASEVEVGGIGGIVNQDGEGFFVVTMLSEDGAAAQDGRLMPGDRLLAIKPGEEAGFVPTKGLNVTTVMNLLRGRVGSPIVLQVVAAGDEPREIDITRGPIYVAGRDVLEQVLATHARLATPAAAKSEEAAIYPSVVIMRSGDVVPCEVLGIDNKSLRLRTPVSDSGTSEPVVVPARLIQAVEIDPSTPARPLEKALLDRLLTLPRSQRMAPPTHMIRLRDGDYLRGRLESLDGQTLVVEVRGEMKKLPRSAVARVIWLHPEQDDGEKADADVDVVNPSGLLVQGVVERLVQQRMTLIADSVEESTIHGTSPALGPGKIDLTTVDRLLIGRAIEKESAELPYRKWRMKPAAEPRSLRDAAATPKVGAD